MKGNNVDWDLRNAERLESNFEELNARFDVLNDALQKILGEEIDLETAGINELNAKLTRIDELRASVVELVDDINNAYNHSNYQGGNSSNVKLLSQDEFVSLIAKIQPFKDSASKKYEELKDAEVIKERLYKTLTEYLDSINEEIAGYDNKIKETEDKLAKERVLLDTTELSDVDRSYHEGLVSLYEKYITNLNNAQAPLNDQREKYAAEIERLLEGGETGYELVDGELVEKNAGVRNMVPNGVEEETEEEVLHPVSEELPAVEEPLSPVEEEQEETSELPPEPEFGGDSSDEGATEEEEKLPPKLDFLQNIGDTSEEDLTGLPPEPEFEGDSSDEGATEEEEELPPEPEKLDGMDEEPELPILGGDDLPEEPSMEPEEEQSENPNLDKDLDEMEEVERVSDASPSLWKKIGIGLMAAATAFLGAIAAHTGIMARTANKLLDKMNNVQVDEESEVVDGEDRIPSNEEVEQPSNPGGSTTPEDTPDSGDEDKPEEDDRTDFEKENGLPIYLADGELAVASNGDSSIEIDHNGETVIHNADGSYSYVGQQDLSHEQIGGTDYGVVGEDNFKLPEEPKKTGDEQSFEDARHDMSYDEAQNALAALNGVPAEVEPEYNSPEYYEKIQEQNNEEIASYDWGSLGLKNNH